MCFHESEAFCHRICHRKSVLGNLLLVNAPGGDYVFCVITKNQEDQSWGADNEGFVLLREVSRLLWHHFEPDADWQPSEGAERY